MVADLNKYERTIERQLKYRRDFNLIEKICGFRPISYIDGYYCEDTYIFKTPQQAKKAYEELEVKRGLLVGWWYGEKDINKELIMNKHYKKVKQYNFIKKI